MSIYKIKDFCKLCTSSINPKSDTLYNLYSLPAYDNNMQCEVVYGREIHSNKFIVPDKCILFNKLNVRFKRIWRVDNKDDNKVASTEFLPLVVDESKVDYQYCYYLLASEFITTYLSGQNSNTSGSHKRIDPEDFLDIEVTVPEISEQRKVGNLLSMMDDKIYLDRKANSLIDTFAQKVYDYWFVQFDFPNEDNKPYRQSGGLLTYNEVLCREIPEGWDVKPISEIAQLNRATLSKRSDMKIIQYLDTSSITMNNILSTQTLRRESAPSRAQRLVKNDTIVYSTVRPNLRHYGILCDPDSNIIVSTGFVTIDAIDSKYSFYLYLSLVQDNVIDYLAHVADTAVSSYPSFNPSDIGDINILCPSKDTLKKWDDLVRPFMEEREKNQREIKELERQRDILHPLLLNGQIAI